MPTFPNDRFTFEVNTNQDDYQKSDIKYVYIFAIVGGSCWWCLYQLHESFHGSFLGRAKENGIGKLWLCVHHWCSISFRVITVWIGLPLCFRLRCVTLLPYFNLLSGKLLTFQSLSNIYFIGALFVDSDCWLIGWNCPIRSI